MPHAKNVNNTAWNWTYLYIFSFIKSTILSTTFDHHITWHKYENKCQNSRFAGRLRLALGNNENLRSTRVIRNFKVMHQVDDFERIAFLLKAKRMKVKCWIGDCLLTFCVSKIMSKQSKHLRTTALPLWVTFKSHFLHCTSGTISAASDE